MATKKNTVPNLRDPEARAAYQKNVRALFKGKQPLKARTIQETVGGTMTQVRTALAVLIEEGFLTWEGQTRAMEYARA